MKRHLLMVLLCACGETVLIRSVPGPGDDAGGETGSGNSPEKWADPQYENTNECTGPGADMCNGCASCTTDDHGNNTFICEPTTTGGFSGSGDCEITAVGTRSLVICKDTNCTVNCYGGYCTMLCLGSANCSFDCTGGHCIYGCATTGTCQLDSWAESECPAPIAPPSDPSEWRGQCFQCGAVNNLCSCSTDSDCPNAWYICGESGVCVAWG